MSRGASRIPLHDLPITDRQRQVLRLIVDLSAKHRRPPTVREVSAALGLSPMGSRDHLTRLMAKGQIEHEPFSCRTLKLTDAGHRTLGLWCSVCQKPAVELYAIPGVFSMRCVPCAKVAMDGAR